MKNSHKLLIVILLLSCGTLKAQTNVSGGIYASTIWTKANSPYIVTDTVVVFPGVILTIEPGVTVKFANNTRLEIREGRIIAWGTKTDSITFTSNADNPTPGLWSGVVLNIDTVKVDTLEFNYCNFKYSNIALDGNSYTNFWYFLTLQNSNFTYNNIGLESGQYNTQIRVDTCNFNNNVYDGMFDITNFVINNCNFWNNGVGLSKYIFSSRSYINNCTFYSNHIGVGDYSNSVMENSTIKFNDYGVVVGPYFGSLSVIKNCIIDSNLATGVTLNDGDTLVSCEIEFNNIGINDSANAGDDNNIITGNIIENNEIGIKLFYSANKIYCNKICNNSIYNLYYDVPFGTNFNAANNYWCIVDSASIASSIYDGYENIDLGLVNFMPLDESLCYLSTGIPIHEDQHLPVNIFPNPATDLFTVELQANSIKTDIKIFNVLGEVVYSSRLTSQKTSIDVSTLANGMYVIQITTTNNIMRQKFIKEKNIP